MIPDAVSDRAFTEAELDAAVTKISDPDRLKAAQDVVMRIAPSLQRVLAQALSDGGWFDSGHDQAVREASATADPTAREREVRTLIAEETRLGMMVGVAVGYQLARELDELERDPGAHDPSNKES
jgi:hypothetical protein